MGIPWNHDPPGFREQIEENVTRLLRRLARETPLRAFPSVTHAQEWHRALFRRIPLPVEYYAGEFRDSDPRYPELIDYEVVVGHHSGVLAEEVPAALERLETQVRQAVARLDDMIPVGGPPRDAGLVGSVVTLCGLAHGEWVRIHPFANGNGRVVRTWANWAALRYGLLPFVSVRPRPQESRYGLAAERSMLGDHQPTIDLFADWLNSQTSEL